MEHQIFIANRKRQAKSLLEEFGAVPVFDVTFAGQDPLFSTLSPMYPHGDLPVPFTEGQLSANSLEAIWQGLKVFEHEGARLDPAFLSKSGCKNIKRHATKQRGRILGHQQGNHTTKPLRSIIAARAQIYAPTYHWQLEHHCPKALAALRKALEHSDIVLLEAGVDSDIRDIFTPMPHSQLLRLYLQGQYPQCGELWQPYTRAEHEADLERRKREQKARIAHQRALRRAMGLTQAAHTP